MTKGVKLLVILILVISLLGILTACSGNDSSSNSGSSDSSTLEASESSPVVAAPATPEAASAEASIPQADAKANADALVGSWKNINDATDFANITKTDSGYQYEDGDGKYEGAFENGMLKVKASDTDTADVYIDPKSGHLITSYQGGLTEYEKK